MGLGLSTVSVIFLLFAVALAVSVILGVVVMQSRTEQSLPDLTEVEETPMREELHTSRTGR